MIIIARYLVDIELVVNKKSNSNQNVNSQTVPPTTQERLLAIPLDTIMLEKCLDVAINEYGFERAKRSSFESRAGIILTLLLTFSVFFIGNLSFLDIFELLQVLDPDTMLRVLIAEGILIMIFTFMCIKCAYYSWLIIKTKKYQNTNLDKFEPKFIMSKKIDGLPLLIKCYKEIIKEHREYNEKYATYIMTSMKNLVFTIFFGIVYLFLH